MALPFEPETIKLPTPEEKLQLSRQRAADIYRNLSQVAQAFDFKRFFRDFADPLVEIYNTDAKKLGFPLATKDWFKILRIADGSAMAPKEFFEKYRSQIQPRLFTGDLKINSKAYDLFLSKLSNLPKITSGPVSGSLAHEFGHTWAYQAEPSVPIAYYSPVDIQQKPLVDKVVSEALASYMGFQKAWKAWQRFGIPKKAWGAWYGFPTYASELSQPQVVELFEKLKKLDSKYSGISDQAHKALYEYHKFIEPVMYNVAGEDWTPEEKIALKRFLESRGGSYKKTLPEGEKERLQHLRSQPYVAKPSMRPLVAQVVVPFSKRS